MLVYSSAAQAFPDTGLITVRNPKANDSEPQKEFYFDAVFNDSVTQKYIYDTCAASVVESVLNGYNGTIFAYGQTGAGKVTILYTVTSCTASNPYVSCTNVVISMVLLK